MRASQTRMNHMWFSLWGRETLKFSTTNSWITCLNTIFDCFSIVFSPDFNFPFFIYSTEKVHFSSHPIGFWWNWEVIHSFRFKQVPLHFREIKCLKLLSAVSSIRQWSHGISASNCHHKIIRNSILHLYRSLDQASFEDKH